MTRMLTFENVFQSIVRRWRAARRRAFSTRFRWARESCNVLQCVAVCCSVLQCVAVCCSEIYRQNSNTQVRVAVCCSVLQCVAVCCSVLQCAFSTILKYATRCHTPPHTAYIQHTATHCNTLPHTDVRFRLYLCKRERERERERANLPYLVHLLRYVSLFPYPLSQKRPIHTIECL